MSNIKSKLSEHKLHKGKFITPFNHLVGKMNDNSWIKNRLAEYIWIGLILHYYGRKKASIIIKNILDRLSVINENIITPKFSEILNLQISEQIELFDFIRSSMNKKILAPLSLLYTYGNYPIFSKYFCDTEIPYKIRRDKLLDVLKECYDHQSDFSTDIRFWVLYYNIKIGKCHMIPSIYEKVKMYTLLEHSDERMKEIRPTIRAIEIMLNEEINEGFCDEFWKKVSSMSDCELCMINWEEDAKKAKEYIEKVHTILSYYNGTLINVSPLDVRKTVLFGLFTYAYKRLHEVFEHNLYNSISGRNSIRVLIENYILIKFLLLEEKNNSNIWTEFIQYGLGAYKAVIARSRDFGTNAKSHVDYELIELLVNEYKNEEFLDIDTSYFGNKSIRDKAKLVNESTLYGLYYDYDSSFEHSLWGAIRESCLLACGNPAHQLHSVPDINNEQNLKSIWFDCVHVMNKIIIVLDSEYSISKKLLNEINEYEKSLCN